MTASSSTLLFQNVAGQLLADPAGFLRVHWGSSTRGLADTQALFTTITQILRQQSWSRVLINQAQMLPFTAAEQQWAAQEWLPVAVREGGYRYGAIVVSPDTYTRLATAFITTNVQGLPLRYRSFDDEATAAAWLRQQPG